MDSMLDQVKTFAQRASAEQRRKLANSLRKLQLELEEPSDVSGRLQLAGLELPIAQVGIDLKIFDILDGNDAALSLAELSDKTGAPEVTLGRILRHLAATGMISETAKNTYRGNNVTSALASEKLQGLVYHHVHIVAPQYRELPRFLKETHYADVTNPSNLPLHRAFDIKEPVFEWFPKQTEAFAQWQKSMALSAGNAVPWYHVYPFKDEIGSFAGPTVFVDVGGGSGGQASAVIKDFPELAGKVILQDLAPSLELNQVPLEGIEKQAHDFFTPQPVKGARFYYLRNILHDYPDEQCLEILKHLKNALGPDSEILVNEIVIPDIGAHPFATQADFLMMTALAARERTEDQWIKLSAAAGLKVKSLTPFVMPQGRSILALVAV